MSYIAAVNLPTSRSFPRNTRYEAVRTTRRHEDDGKLGSGFITIKPTVPSPPQQATIPCKCNMRYGKWISPAEPEFTCNYIPSQDRFMSFNAPKFLEDSTGANSGYRGNDGAAIMEIGKATIEERKPTLMTSRYPKLEIEQCDEFDDNGHSFLLVTIAYFPDERSSPWEQYHNTRKIWFKRVVKGKSTRISEQERARVAADDSGDECVECRECTDSDGEEGEEGSGDAEEDDVSVGGNGDDG